MLDFGRELHGSLQIVIGPTQDKKVARLRLRFGESASEAMGNPNNDHALHDFEIFAPPMASQEYGMTGFRFARLDLLDDNLELPLVAVRAISLMHELPQIGEFRCSDERLNRIWQTGADTVALCMQDHLWDGPKRDRLVWMGDLHPEIAVVSAVWGAHEIVPQSLDWVRDQTPLPGWMNNLGSYSMWWIIIQRDWFWHHGNREYLENQRAYLTGLIQFLCEQIETNGEVSWRGREFLDWPSSKNPLHVRAGLHALLLWSLQAGAQLCEVLEENEAAKIARDGIENLKKKPPSPILESKQASALLAISGLADAAQINAQVLAQSPLSGISSFYGFYVLQARAQAGDFGGCLELIRRYWGAMLDLGATSFWEDFDLEWAQNASRIDEIPLSHQSDLHFERGDFCYKSWRHSLCHGWAAGPTAWLTQWVLGVSPLEIGCRRVQIAPHLGDLDWVEGAFPTPFGAVRVRHERGADGTVHSQIEAPREVLSLD